MKKAAKKVKEKTPEPVKTTPEPVKQVKPEQPESVKEVIVEKPVIEAKPEVVPEVKVEPKEEVKIEKVEIKPEVKVLINETRQSDMEAESKEAIIALVEHAEALGNSFQVLNHRLISREEQVVKERGRAL